MSMVLFRVTRVMSLIMGRARHCSNDESICSTSYELTPPNQSSHRPQHYLTNTCNNNAGICGCVHGCEHRGQSHVRGDYSAVLQNLPQRPRIFFVPSVARDDVAGTDASNVSRTAPAQPMSQGLTFSFSSRCHTTDAGTEEEIFQASAAGAPTCMAGRIVVALATRPDSAGLAQDRHNVVGVAKAFNRRFHD